MWWLTRLHNRLHGHDIKKSKINNKINLIKKFV